MTLPQMFFTFFIVPAIMACLAAAAYNAWLAYRWWGSYRQADYLLGVTWFWFCTGGLTLLYGAQMDWWGHP